MLGSFLTIHPSYCYHQQFLRQHQSDKSYDIIKHIYSDIYISKITIKVKHKKYDPVNSNK